MASADIDPQWLNATEQDAWRRFISGASRLIERLDQDLKAHGITHDDYAVLVHLSEAADNRLRMADLADQVVESRSRLSHHIGRLEARGLVQRESCPNDRRGFFAVLTDEGRAMIERTAPVHVSGVRHWFLDQLDPQELQTLAQVFERVDRGLGCPDSGLPCEG
jgi:DNA-binding MarR family transcriptional regulator